MYINKKYSKRERKCQARSKNTLMWGRVYADQENQRVITLPIQNSPITNQRVTVLLSHKRSLSSILHTWLNTDFPYLCEAFPAKSSVSFLLRVHCTDARSTISVPGSVLSTLGHPNAKSHTSNKAVYLKKCCFYKDKPRKPSNRSGGIANGGQYINYLKQVSE